MQSEKRMKKVLIEILAKKKKEISEDEKKFR